MTELLANSQWQSMQQWSQDITLLATSFLSTSREANLLKSLQIVHVPPEFENTKVVKHPISGPLHKYALHISSAFFGLRIH